MPTKLQDYQAAQDISKSVKEIQDITLDDVGTNKTIEGKKILAVITAPGKKLVLFDNPKVKEEQGLAVKAFMEWAK